jgi:hypothetical protein
LDKKKKSKEKAEVEHSTPSGFSAITSTVDLRAILRHQKFRTFSVYLRESVPRDTRFVLLSELVNDSDRPMMLIDESEVVLVANEGVPDVLNFSIFLSLTLSIQLLTHF